MKNETIKNILKENERFVRYLVRCIIRSEKQCCKYFYVDRYSGLIYTYKNKLKGNEDLIYHDVNDLIFLFKLDNFSLFDLGVTEDDIVNDIIANYNYEVISTLAEFAKKHNQFVKAESEYFKSDDDDDDDENEYGKKIDKLKCELMTYYNQMRLPGIIMNCQGLDDAIMQLIICMQNHELYI